MARGSTALSSMVRTLVLGVAAFSLSACMGEGEAPQKALVGTEEIPVHRLTSLTDPYSDLYVSMERQMVLDFGRVEAVIECERRGYICVEWPFVFAFPESGEPPANGWSAADYDFRVVTRAERDFCGRTRKAYLVEGYNGVGWATRVWYHPGFGVYAVMTGQAEDGDLVTIERAYTTCDRGLLARQGGGFGLGG
jgi:hypothetical protein